MKTLARQLPRNAYVLLAAGLLLGSAGTLRAEITEVFTGFDLYDDLTIDSADHVYANGILDRKVVKIDPSGVITTVADAESSGLGTFDVTTALHVDSFDNLYLAARVDILKVAAGTTNPTLFFTPSGLVSGLASNAAGSIFAAETITDSVYEISPAGVGTVVVDATGDGLGNTLNQPVRVAVDGLGNLFVGALSTTLGTGPKPILFKRTPAGTVTLLMDSFGDGPSGLLRPFGLTTDGANNVFVSGVDTDNAFRVTPGGAITELIDDNGDGLGNTLDMPHDIATDGSGNLFVIGSDTHNVFRITPAGVITEVIDIDGDGLGAEFRNPTSIVTDSGDNAYVLGADSETILSVTPGGAVTRFAGSVFLDDFVIVNDGSDRFFFAADGGVFELLADDTIVPVATTQGDGLGNFMLDAYAIAADAAGNLYVCAVDSDNAFKITLGGAITEIIDGTGDGVNDLDGCEDIAVDASGNVFVAGRESLNAFKITPGGMISQIIDASGDGTTNLNRPSHVAVDGAGNSFVTGDGPDAVFKIEPGGAITRIADVSGAGPGQELLRPSGIATDTLGNVYVSGADSSNVLKITPVGEITEIIDGQGDNTGNVLLTAVRVETDAADNVYVSGEDSDNAFRITSGGVITEILDDKGEFPTPFPANDAHDRPRTIRVASDGAVYVSAIGSNNAHRITFETATCPLTVGMECFDSTAAKLNAKETQPGRESLKLKWKIAFSGPNKGDFGNPAEGDTSIAICLYDDAGALIQDYLVDRGNDVCDGRDCWSGGSGGYKYRDRATTSDGIAGIKFARTSGGTLLSVKGKNNANKGQASLPIGIASALSTESTPTLQFYTSDEVCVTAQLNQVKKATGGLFKGSLK